MHTREKPVVAVVALFPNTPSGMIMGIEFDIVERKI